jgi:ribosomal protein S18 acetylase RimI-like enzyme
MENRMPGSADTSTETGTLADVDACTALWMRALEARDSERPPEQTADRVRADFDEEWVSFRVIRADDGTVAAFGLVLPPASSAAEQIAPQISSMPELRDSAYLALLAVDPAVQGRGAGSALLRELADDSAREGHPAVFLYVRTDNVAAVGLYERNGFEPFGEPFVHPSIGKHFRTYVRRL